MAKSKLYKYRIVESRLRDVLVYKIEFRKRFRIPSWASIHASFNTKEEAEREIDMYISHDNED